MKTNLIEITVSGRTGKGKSEVLEVIKMALRDHYGINAKITGKNVDGAIEEADATGQTAKGSKTVFVLFEQNVSGDFTVYD